MSDFAAKKNQDCNGFIAASEDEAEKHMEEMAEKYREGGDLHVKSGG